MEEILASIRRIIAEDGEQPAAAAPAPAPAPAAGPAPAAAPPAPAAKGEEILELTEVVEEQSAEPPPAPEPPRPEPAPIPASAPSAADSGDRLVSEAAAAASIAALSQIHQIGSQSEKRMSDIPLGDGGPTSIESMVRDMLRPLLKQWLDSNLPHLVERVVQDEVSRLVRDTQKR